MPNYDESFIHDDNLNQRRNKRSYRVYKNGLSPFNVLQNTYAIHTIEERNAPVITRNIRNIKHRGYRYKPELHYISQSFVPSNYKSTDFIIDRYAKISVFDPNKYYDIRNNNLSSLSPCKSLDNLTSKHSKKKEPSKDKIRNGCSLQNLVDDEKLKYYASPSEEPLTRIRRDDHKNSYFVTDDRRRPVQRRLSRSTVAPDVGVYRQFSNDGATVKHGPGMTVSTLNLIVLVLFY